jgi:hypothetical protein
VGAAAATVKLEMVLEVDRDNEREGSGRRHLQCTVAVREVTAHMRRDAGGLCIVGHRGVRGLVMELERERRGCMLMGERVRGEGAVRGAFRKG